VWAEGRAAVEEEGGPEEKAPAGAEGGAAAAGGGGVCDEERLRSAGELGRVPAGQSCHPLAGGGAGSAGGRRGELTEGHFLQLLQLALLLVLACRSSRDGPNAGAGAEGAAGGGAEGASGEDPNRAAGGTRGAPRAMGGRGRQAAARAAERPFGLEGGRRFGLKAGRRQLRLDGGRPRLGGWRAGQGGGSRLVDVQVKKRWVGEDYELKNHDLLA